MRCFSSAICYDMNIIRRAAVPFQATRKAFSTNSECISACWNSQKWKTDAAKDTTDISWRNHYQSFNSIFWSLIETSEESQSPGKEAIRRGGSNFLIAGPTSVSSPQITSDHCTRIPSDSVWEGGCGDKGSFCGWQWRTLMAFEGRGDRQEKFRSETSLKQENIMKRIAK